MQLGGQCDLCGGFEINKHHQDAVTASNAENCGDQRSGPAATLEPGALRVKYAWSSLRFKVLRLVSLTQCMTK